MSLPPPTHAVMMKGNEAVIAAIFDVVLEDCGPLARSVRERMGIPFGRHIQFVTDHDTGMLWVQLQTPWTEQDEKEAWENEPEENEE